jgi:hypothetical protein
MRVCLFTAYTVAELASKLRVGRQTFLAQHINSQLTIEIHESPVVRQPMVQCLHHESLHHLRESKVKMKISLLQLFEIVMQYLYLSSYFNL